MDVTIELDNLDRDDGAVNLYVRSRDAVRWARENQSVAGSRLEGITDGFPHAVVCDHPGLTDEIAAECPGTELDLDNYYPPDGP